MKRTLKMFFPVLLVTTLAAAAYLSVRPAAAQKPAADKPDAAAVDRARRTVQMLDEVYKQTIVLITDKYVNKQEDFAAGSAAVLLFKNISKSGNQSVRLIDATGEPYEPENVAKDAFEKEGVKKLRAGAKTHEEVVQGKDGKYEFRAMTPVPVVMDKCTMCHDNYVAAKKKGEVIGAISYTVPIR